MLFYIRFLNGVLRRRIFICLLDRARYWAFIKKGTIITYLFGYENDNPSAEYMTYKVLEAPLSKEVTETYYTKNLKKAKEFFANNISNLYEEAGVNGFETINVLYKKLTNHLMFNLHEILRRPSLDDRYHNLDHLI